MLKRWIVMFGLFTLMVIPAAAQDATPIPPEAAREQQWILEMVEQVEIQEQDAQPVLLITGTLTGTCEPVDRTEVHRAGVALFVDLYRTLNPAIRCIAAETPFEMIVPVPELLELDEDATLPQYLVVNDKYYFISIAEIEFPPETPPAVPPMMLFEMEKDLNTSVQEVEIVPGAEFYELHVQALIGNGCPDPLIARAQRNPNVEDDYSLQVFRLLPLDTMCPTIFVPVTIDTVAETDQPITEPIVVREGEKEYAAMPEFDIEITPLPEGEGTFRSPHTIESVDVLIRESAPPQYVAHVEGYQPDGCTYPVEVVQTREGSTVKIEIFRVMSAAAACPMMIVEYSADIVLEGSFEPGEYTVDVNGISDTFQGQ